MRPTLSVKLPGRPVDMIVTPTDGGRIFVAEGKTVHVLSADGKPIRKLQTDGLIRMLRWWPEHNLLLAGCADEKVIAFDPQGRRRWTFTSQMDPAVFRAAKTYWFKSDPRHAGIHGLYTGVFIGGRSQAFVGSACTLEVLDERGRLIKRLPQFWGDVSTFAIIDGPNGTLNLLAARKTNGNDRVRVINNKKLDPGYLSFYTVPRGYTYVSGWSAMNRHHLFYEDMDGDGQKEVISEVNGTWNRVTIWDRQGRALYNANFGPGKRIPAKNVRDVDIGDLDGDGRKEILVALSSGLVIALDCRCEKVWATRLPGPPTVMKIMPRQNGRPPWIVVGCANGVVLVLDPGGKIVAQSTLSGRATHIAAMGPNVLLASTSRRESRLYAFLPP